jgi:UDP-glucuronate decarboxylase
MRVLVTGGAGFIGGHLCERLVTEGYRVTVLDDLSTAHGDSVSPKQKFPGCEFVQRDVAEAFDMDVDVIFHLACPASPVHYQRDPVRTLMTAILGTKSMLDLARQSGATMLMTSTSEVYGDPDRHPQNEDYWGHVNPIGPRACYDEGKRAAETLAMDYLRQHSVIVKVARLFNTYGPGMAPHDGRVVPTFIRDALAGDPLVIHGDGGQTRSFCYVTDVVDALMRMMATSAAIVGPINIGNPDEISMLDLARLTLVKTGSDSRISFTERPQDDPERRRPDISRARTLLQWAPSTGLDDGLAQTIDHFRRTHPMNAVTR